jgi:hypothetical protein
MHESALPRGVEATKLKFNIFRLRVGFPFSFLFFYEAAAWLLIIAGSQETTLWRRIPFVCVNSS